MADKKKGPGAPKMKKVEPVSIVDKVRCLRCDNEFDVGDMYKTRSITFRGTGRIPYCKRCLGLLFDEYVEEYTNFGFRSPRRKATERMCMLLDLYYNDEIFDTATKLMEKTSYKDKHFVEAYMNQSNMQQNLRKNYNTTVKEHYEESRLSGALYTEASEKSEEEQEIIKKATRLFGRGYAEDDYLYLYDQYMDWTSRHECSTKAQEEIFKRLSCLQLEILKATRKGESTTNLDKTYREYMDTGKIAPKQTSGEAMSEAQTFGTLIDKWENTRPIPETEDDLKDVDKIGLLLDVFFKGHLAKMVGIKNGLSNQYDKYMEKYTVRKPEYRTDDNDYEPMFDAIFGKIAAEEE